jgi:MFS family permease
VEDIAITGEEVAGPSPDAEVVEGARPTAPLPTSHLVRISLYWLGMTAVDAAVTQFIAFRLAFSDIRGDISIGLATTLLTVGGAVLAILIQPTMGSISDYAVTKWGRRKPFIVFGTLLDVVFLVGIANGNTLLAIGAFVMLLTFSTNIARGPFQGYVPDLVAEHQVGMASSMVGMMQILGNVSGLVLANLAAVVDDLPLALFAVAIVELVTMVSVVLRVGKGMPPKSRQGRSWLAIAAETWGTDILQETSYLWLVASRLFFLTAGGILFAYVTVFMRDVFRMSQAEAGMTNLAVIVAVVLGNVAAVVPASRLSDRIGRKPVIYAACACGGLGAAIAALSPAVPIAIAGGALFGAANGTFLAVDWALMTDIIPRASAGRYMGLSNVATGSAPLLAAALGGLVLDFVAAQTTPALGARTAFLVAVVLFTVSAFLLRPVVEPRRGRAEVSPAAAV